ncbi:transcription factor AP-4 [Culicoides brevitarsis]|uniref:transcription factor AP-4 n=1 Tax=Culicoides brevitarsis TaxID=469753 RepID=UPI00307CA013
MSSSEVYIIKEVKHPIDDEIEHHQTIQSHLEEDLQSGSGNTVTIMDHDEKRMRRQIANSNERRRMQSINAGFQSLRDLLPHHEGEKLSKASILQQTAEYIYNLEQEKARLLNQNCQLKRLLDQHDPGSAAAVTADFNPQSTAPSATTATMIAAGTKKRKLEGGQIVVQAVSDSSDEGLGSMSPEPVPVTILNMGKIGSGGTTTTTATTTTTLPGNATLQIRAQDYIEMKRELERERNQRVRLEEQMRQVECQIYPDRVQYQEVIDHTDNVRDEHEQQVIIQEHGGKMSLAQLKESGMENVQVLSLDAIPTVGQTQVVVCSPVGELIEENSRPISPSDLMQAPENIKHENIIIATSGGASAGKKQQRIVSSILEAAIKAEPKVEVERIEAPSTIVIEDGSKSSRHGSPAPANCMYVTNTSRQNLQAIVAAIEHLEGEHYVEKVVEQDAPLALTNKQIAVRDREHRKIQSEIHPFLKFKQVTVSKSAFAPGQTVTLQTSSAAAPHDTLKSNTTTICNIQQQQMSRPGVIVVKHQKQN